MILKAKRAAESYDAVRILMQLALPGMVAYKVKKISDALKKTAEAFHAGRDAIIKELGTEDDKYPGQFSVMGPNLKTFDARLKEIAELEEEVDDVRPLYLDELENVQFPGFVYEHLDWCITERPKTTP